jgi:hypothetical protein
MEEENMTTRRLTILFGSLAGCILLATLVHAYLATANHVLLGVALAAAAASIAADPDFVLQDAKHVFTPSRAKKTDASYPVTASATLLIALICLASWLFMMVF